MKTARLSEVCKLVNGGTPKSGVADYWGGDVAWLTPAEMGKRITPYITETARTISRTGLANCSAREVPVGSVIMSTRAPIGHLAIPEVPMAFNQGCRGLIPNESLDTKYLYYFLWFSRDALKELGTGATFRELSGGALGNYCIPLPPLEEQRRIVAVLDEAFAAIATATVNAEKNLVNARELFGSLADVAFSEISAGVADLARLGDMTAEGAGITYGVVKPGPEGSVAFVRGGDLVDGEIRMDQLRTISSEFSHQYRRTLLQGGELLICLVGTPGQCAIAPAELAGANIARQVGMVRLRDDIKADYVRDYLLSGSGQRALGLKTGGSVQQVINLGDLKLIQIPLPDFAIQSATVEKIAAAKSATRALEMRYRAKLRYLADLKQSLLDRAFAGKLTSKAAKVVAVNDNFATPEFAAKIVAFAYERHVAKNRARNFGTVKAEKILHMVEAIGGIDLGRQPLREAAGPDDATHRHATWDWARSMQFFRFNKRSGGGHDFEKLSLYSRMIEDARTAIAGTAVEKAIELLVDMDRDFAELIATTYAAWNNLIIDQCAAMDDDIVLAARDNWHRDKLRFDPSKFHDAIRFIRNNSIVPDGTAKRVGGQEALLF